MLNKQGKELSEVRTICTSSNGNGRSCKLRLIRIACFGADNRPVTLGEFLRVVPVALADDGTDAETSQDSQRRSADIRRYQRLSFRRRTNS
jgi:hypothetical protein